jgi:hypothetical protein
MQRIVCHLYLQTALHALNSMNSADLKAERERIRIFLADFSSLLSKQLVLAWLHSSGQSALVAPALLTFKDYEALALRYLVSEPQDNQGLRKIIPHLSELAQRQVYLRGLTRDTMGWVEFLDAHPSAPLDALFDGLAALALSVVPTSGSREIRANARDLLHIFYEGGRLTAPAHLHTYFLTMVLLKEADKVQAFLNSPAFDAIEKDFVANFLVRQNELAVAAQVYARVPDRHILAVKCAARVSLDAAAELLRTAIGDADDTTACWTELLALAAADAAQGRPVKWEELVPRAHRRGVTLDEIFQRLPPGLEVGALDRTVAMAVKQTSRKIKESKDVREEIERRSEEQRQSVAAQIAQPLEIDPAQALCFFCGQPACDASFVVYPCLHVIHVSCAKLQYPGYAGDVELFRQSCPACGVAALQILNQPFIGLDKEKEEFALWDVPF